MRQLAAEYTLYLDVVFLQNFLMNAFVLALTGRMMRQTCRAGRIASGAAAGALWACGGIFLPLSFPMKAALTCGPVSILMVFLAFRERNLVRLLKGTAALYLTAVLMAGGLEFIRNLSSRVYNYENPVTSRQQKLPFYVLFFAAAAVFFLICFLLEAVREEQRRRSHLADATVFFQGRSIQVRAFLDTGNRLADPVSGRPVSVIWAGALKNCFEGAPGVILIPYRSVGKESGLLPAVKADRICIEMDGKQGELKNPLIAVSKAPLSSDGSYEMLLHEAFWEKAVKSERPWNPGGTERRRTKKKGEKSSQAEGKQETAKSERDGGSREDRDTDTDGENRKTPKEKACRKAGRGRLAEPKTSGKKGKETKRKNDALGKEGTEKCGSEGKAGLENSGSLQMEDSGKSGRKVPENQSGGEKYGD